MSKPRYEIEICEAENGFVVCWKRLGYPDEEILLCPETTDVTREVARIIDSWKIIDRS